MIGRASASGPAGPTRIALLIDATGSTNRPSGADLDHDGREESILIAEVVAGRQLLAELETVEAKSPGTAFEMSIVRFGTEVKVMAPLAKMSEPQGLKSLRVALDRVAADGTVGDNNDPVGFDEAVKALKIGERAGKYVILFMSDGGVSLSRLATGGLQNTLDAAARAGLAGVIVHTVGMGKEFSGVIPQTPAFPPSPSDGVEILASAAALGAPGGIVTPLPLPADVVKIVPHLPIFEVPEADIQEVQVVNESNGKPALSVQLSRDGAFQAEVPVSLMPRAELETNSLVATAVARDGISKATDRVWVQCPPQPASLALIYRRRASSAAAGEAPAVDRNHSRLFRKHAGECRRQAQEPDRPCDGR